MVLLWLSGEELHWCVQKHYRGPPKPLTIQSAGLATSLVHQSANLLLAKYSQDAVQLEPPLLSTEGFWGKKTNSSLVSTSTVSTLEYRSQQAFLQQQKMNLDYTVLTLTPCIQLMVLAINHSFPKSSIPSTMMQQLGTLAKPACVWRNIPPNKHIFLKGGSIPDPASVAQRPSGNQLGQGPRWSFSKR